MRRLWKDEDNEDRKETTKMMGKRKKYRARRKRVSYYWFNFVFCGFISITCSSSLHSFDQKFDNRALVILPSEMSHWKQLSLTLCLRNQMMKRTPTVLLSIHWNGDQNVSVQGHNNFDVVLYCLSMQLFCRTHWLPLSVGCTVWRKSSKRRHKDGKEVQEGWKSQLHKSPVNTPDWTLDNSFQH